MSEKKSLSFAERFMVAGAVSAALAAYIGFGHLLDNEMDGVKPGDVFSKLADKASLVGNIDGAAQAEACYFVSPAKTEDVYFNEFIHGPFRDAARFTFRTTPRKIGSLPVMDTAPCAVIDPAQRMTADEARKRAISAVGALQASPAARALIADPQANDRKGKLSMDIVATPSF